jgi:hypothetical protein
MQLVTQTSRTKMNCGYTRLSLFFGNLMALWILYVYLAHLTITAAPDVSLALDKVTGVHYPYVLKSLLEHTSAPMTPASMATASYTPACDNFFTVLASSWVPTEGNCSYVYDKYRDMIHEHEASMQRMGKTLTIFTTWTQQELQQEGCGDLVNFGFNVSSKYIQLQQFDPEMLMEKSRLYFDPCQLDEAMAYFSATTTGYCDPAQ